MTSRKAIIDIIWEATEPLCPNEECTYHKHAPTLGLPILKTKYWHERWDMKTLEVHLYCPKCDKIYEIKKKIEVAQVGEGNV